MFPKTAGIIFAAAILTTSVQSAERHFEDAALNAVQFVDPQEGWAVGDAGTIWHTINGGKNWERQPSGVSASLRSICFLNPYTGWIAGRDELPDGDSGGTSPRSLGVLLFTKDGGLSWRQTTLNSLPGLNCVRFLNVKTGFVAGDATEQFPTGVFRTTDTGRTWKPIPGPRMPGWLAMDFPDESNAALAGPWSRLGTLRGQEIGPADVDMLGPRAVRNLKLAGNDAVAVGQGGLVLLSRNTGGARWTYADLQLPTNLRNDWDFHAASWIGDHIWVVGRPGCALLHSSDRGQTWEVLNTNQPLPLNGMFFSDQAHGWAVGELGTILATVDGGKTWKVQQRGGQRAAALFIHSRPSGLLLDTIALLGGQDGYITVAVQVTGPDPNSASMDQAGLPLRLAAANRKVGGAAGEMFWQFPLPQHLVRADERQILQAWDRLHSERSSEALLRHLVLTLRTWRPDVVITDSPEAKVGGWTSDALLAQALQEAFKQAADEKAFSDQLTLGLQPWSVSKLYARWPSQEGAEVAIDLNDPSPRLSGTPRDFAEPAAALLTDQTLPTRRFFHLLASRIDGAANHHQLMQGLSLAAGGTARREQPLLMEPSDEWLQGTRLRRNLETMAQKPANSLTGPDQLLAQVGPMLSQMPEDQAPAAAMALGNAYARMGQWKMAREIYRLVINRFPTYLGAIDAYRWLVRYDCSGETRRLRELTQQVILTKSDKVVSEELLSLPASGIQQISAIMKGEVKRKTEGIVATLSDPIETRKWNENCLKMGDQLAAFGPAFANDPSIQFCLQAVHRNLGEFEQARDWYTKFRRDAAPGPWREAAAAELWLLNRSGPPPKPVAICWKTPTRPYLDGQFDDECWKDMKPINLKNAVGDTLKEFPTEAWLAYDKEFLYLALRCRHPEGRRIEPVKTRPHDADLRTYDRVGLLLDLDRDYSTYFHLQVDQRGCVCDDCWGDPGWNPHWYVTVHSESTSWQVEAAIPLVEMTSDPVTVGKSWACNIVRTIPGRGVQALSTPADVQPRPEGMGLLIFNERPSGADARKSENRK
jgi:photosystem II stability/assembly factor-like uncharacterized protein/tetratricopeptide (TPR) repeat protein